MRVVCIDESEQDNHNIGGPTVKLGKIYTVLEILNHKKMKCASYFNPAKGQYYVLIETGDRYAFHSSLFLPINEDQQDETEFERNELVKEMKS